MDISTYPDAVKEIVASVKDRRLAIMCGAGISLHSGLPLAGQLVDAVLKKLQIESPQRELLLPSAFPFEAFMQSLREESDDLSLLELFKLGHPNVNHMLMAKLVKLGYLRSICTTNFDELIEQALAAEGCKPGADYQLSYDEATFLEMDWATKAAARVLKVHGSVASRASMAITLKQVASQSLSTPRRTVIEHLFSSGGHDTVLVLGYSSSDQFDLSPHIESLKDKSKRIFLVEHCSHGVAAIEQLSARQGTHPFRGYPGYCISCNTDDLVRSMWESCLPVTYTAPTPQDGQNNWKKFVEDWHAGLTKTPGVALAVAGNLFMSVTEANEALPWLRKAADAAKNAGDHHRMARHLSNLGLALSHVGKYEDAIGVHDESLRIAEPSDKRTGAINLHNKGSAYRFLGKYELAIESHESAARLAQELGDAKGFAASIAAAGDAASDLGDFDKAIAFLRHALKITQDTTDLLGAVTKWSSLGSVYQKAGKLREARQHYESGLALARQLGQKKSIAVILGNLGVVNLQLGDAEGAITYLSESLRSARASPDPYGEAQTLGALSDAYLILGRYTDALESSIQGYNLARTLGNPQTLLRHCMQLSVMYKKLQDHVSAKRYRDEAVAIVRTHGLKVAVDAQIRSMEAPDPAHRKAIQGLPALDPNYPLAALMDLQNGWVEQERARLKPFGDYLERNLKYLEGLSKVTGVCLMVTFGTMFYRIEHADSVVVRWLAVICTVVSAVLAVACFKAANRASQLIWEVFQAGIPLQVYIRGYRLLLKVAGTLCFIVAISFPIWVFWQLASS